MAELDASELDASLNRKVRLERVGGALLVAGVYAGAIVTVIWMGGLIFFAMREVAPVFF